MIRVTVKTCGATVTVDGETAKDAIREAAFFQSLPEECPVCSSGLRFDYRVAQEYKYFELLCERGHKHQLGQHRDGEGLFYNAQKPWQEFDPDLREWVEARGE